MRAAAPVRGRRDGAESARGRGRAARGSSMSALEAVLSLPGGRLGREIVRRWSPAKSEMQAAPPRLPEAKRRVGARSLLCGVDVAVVQSELMMLVDISGQFKDSNGG